MQADIRETAQQIRECAEFIARQMRTIENHPISELDDFTVLAAFKKITENCSKMETLLPYLYLSRLQGVYVSPVATPQPLELSH
jgi:hypothetical protein